MFTFKFEGSNGAEFLTEAGSVTARRDYQHDTIQIVAKETDSDDSRTIGIWGGRYLPHRLSRAEDGEGWANIYVMNRDGATVATYRYAFDLDTLVEESFPPITDPAELQEAA